jgi:hypothetical protein
VGLMFSELLTDAEDDEDISTSSAASGQPAKRSRSRPATMGLYKGIAEARRLAAAEMRALFPQEGKPRRS